MIFNLKLRSCFLTILGSTVLAFGLYNIHSLSGITEGGVLGLALLLEHHLSISPAISALFFNILCYFFGWRRLGCNFIGYSIFAVVSFSLFYAILEMFPPLFPQIAEFPLVAALVGAVFVGVGVGISVRAGGAPSGDDALAMSLSSLLRTDIKWIYLASDVIVLALSLSYIPPERIFYSLITVIVSGQIIGLLQKPDKPEEVTPRNMRDVLCGTLRNKDQLDVCLKNKFYHIPAIRLRSGDFPIRYIAIYQSLHKFKEGAGIIYYGEIEKYSLVRRNEITEIPRSSDEMYYRFDIKDWKKLPEKIVPDCGDFVNLTTTMFLLTHSRTTSELFLESEREFEFLRKIEQLISGERSEIVSESGDTVLRVSNATLVLSKGDLPLFSCAIDDYKVNPKMPFDCFFKELNS